MVKVYTSIERYERVLSFVDNFFWPVLVLPTFGGKTPLFCPKNDKKVVSVLKNAPIVNVYTLLEPYGWVLSFVDSFWSPYFGGKTPLFCPKMSRKLIARSKMVRLSKFISRFRTIWTSIVFFGQISFWSLTFWGITPLFGPNKFKRVNSAFKNGPIVKVYTLLEPYGRVLSFLDNIFLARFGPPFFAQNAPFLSKKCKKKVDTAFKNDPIVILLPS